MPMDDGASCTGLAYEEGVAECFTGDSEEFCNSDESIALRADDTADLREDAKCGEK